MLRILAVIAGTMLACWAGTAWAADVEPAASDTTRQVRSPKGAMLRSLALPGWGQFYNGRVVKGGIVAAAEVGSAAAFFVRRRRIDREAEADATERRNVYFFTTIGAVLYSMIDAYVDAHLDAVDWGGVQVEPGDAGGEMRVVLRVRF